MYQQCEDVTSTSAAPSATTHKAQAFTLAVLAGTTMSLAQSGSIPGLGTTDPTTPTVDPQPTGSQLANPFDRDETQAGTDLIDDGSVKVTDDLLVDLHVQDEDLGKILQLLSIQSQRNIIASQNVSANITANLYNVTFYEALDAILGVNGYGYIERGNFIEVYTLEELKTIYEENRPIEQRVIYLNYISPPDAAEFVQPLLSEKGTIKAPGQLEEFTLPDNTPTGAQDYALGSLVVVFDLEENIDKIEEMLAQIDTKPQMVLIESTILQTSVNEDNAWGIDFALLGNLDFGDFIQINPVDGLRAGLGNGFSDDGAGGTTLGDKQVFRDGFQGAGSTGVIDPSKASTIKLGLVSGDFGMFVNALDAVADTTILSRPNILTLNRQRARVLVGRKVGYLSTTTTQTSTTQAVEFLDTGTQLHVRPIVGNDGMIRVELLPRVSEAVIRNVTDATGAAVTIPDEITNELTTNVIVRDGQIIVLGGLFRESTINGRTQVPFLGDIPFIGPAFQGHTNEIKRNELIFMVKPSIVNDNMLLDQSTEAEKYVNNVRTGSREGLLPWSREKQSAQLLVRAQDMAKEGDFDEALYLVQRSLALNPYQPEAIAMRDHLLNQTTVWPSRSFLEEVINTSTQNLLSSLDNDSLSNWQAGDEFEPTTDELFVEAPALESEPTVSEPATFTTGTEPDANGADGQAPEPGSFEREPGMSDETFSQAETEESSPSFADPDEIFNTESTEMVISDPNMMSGSMQSPIESDDNAMITMSVHGQDIRDVIELISLASGENIVVGDNVSGTVDVEFVDATVDEALEQIAEQSGFIFAHLGSTYAVTAPKFTPEQSTPAFASSGELPTESMTESMTESTSESSNEFNTTFEFDPSSSMTTNSPSESVTEPSETFTPYEPDAEFDAFANAALNSSGTSSSESPLGNEFTMSNMSNGLESNGLESNGLESGSTMTEANEPSTSNEFEFTAEPSMTVATGNEMETGSFGLAELEAAELANAPTGNIEFKPAKRSSMPESRDVTGKTASSSVGNPNFAKEIFAPARADKTIDTLFDIYISQHIWGSSMPAMTLNTTNFAPAGTGSAF